MKQILKEPLLHFVVLGVLLVFTYGFWSGPGSGERGEIVITQGEIGHLADGFARAWQRPPSPQELTGLVHARIREEVLYREGIALGLDNGNDISLGFLRMKVSESVEQLRPILEPLTAGRI